MKKIIAISMVVAVCLTALFSFKSGKIAKYYGGSGSARISVYNTKFSLVDGNWKNVRTTKAKSEMINVTVSCVKYDDADARDSIKKQIEYEATQKTGSNQEWEFDSSIDYKITTCER